MPVTLHELSGVNDGQVLMEEVSKDQESDLCNNNPTAGANLHMFQQRFCWEPLSDRLTATFCLRTRVSFWVNCSEVDTRADWCRSTSHHQHQRWVRGTLLLTLLPQHHSLASIVPPHGRRYISSSVTRDSTEFVPFASSCSFRWLLKSPVSLCSLHFSYVVIILFPDCSSKRW